MAEQKITTFLWFDTQAEEAAKFYVSIFKGDSKVISANPMSATFELAGQRYLALNGGPSRKFNEAISLFVSCEDQAEVDRFWDALIAGGGSPSQCGWLKDKYGLSWQIIPKRLMELMGDPKVVQAMLGMQKIVVADLERAHGGKS
ncbi:MAG: VOC family protein [Archangium sp.]|nr:VOC family protein [Archangium sp.]